MEKTDTCSLKDQKTMEVSTVWMWRITHVKKYSRHPDPFQYSNEIGLDFNVASKQTKKLNLQLLTNDVILEVCNFAQTVTKSKWLFVTNILENNFDLGFKNEQQRIDFTAQIVHKVKDLVREPPHDKHEVFALFDTSSKSECASNSNNRLNMTSPDTESFLQQVDDTDDSEHEEEFKRSQATSKEYTETESLLDDMDVAHADDSEQEDKFKFSEVQSEKQLKEDLPPSFPYCEEIGLNLDIGSKQSLDPGLLTKGVLLELVHFTRVLTSSYSRIIMDLLEHNFDLNLKDQQIKNRVWFKISHLLKRKRQLTTTGSQTAPEFKDEPFSFQINPFKIPSASALSNMEAPHNQSKEVTKTKQSDFKCDQEKKHMETNTVCQHTILCASEKTEVDHPRTCALEESELDSDEVTNSGSACNQGHLQNPTNSDFPREQESSCLNIRQNFLTISDVFPSSLPVNSILKPPFASQPDKTGLSGGKGVAQTSKNTLKECDMDHEEIVTEPNMWKLRGNRVEQILSSLNKEFGSFKWSRRYGLEFNVGFCSKQNIGVDLLTRYILLEIAEFSLAMNSSQQYFIMEILEYNFDLGLQTQQQRNTFACETMNRVRQLRRCEDAVKLSNEVFELPGPMPSLNMSNQNVDSVSPELSSTSPKEKCDVAPPCPPDSHSETRTHTSHKSVGLYPSCKKIGLKLHVNNSQPNKKLDINTLTNGAMLEVTNFAEELCGTFEQICLDIIRHNFELDLQSGDSDLTENIFARITAAVEQRNRSCSANAFKQIEVATKIFLTTGKLDCKKTQNLDACSASSSEAAIIQQTVGNSSDTQEKNYLNLKLWKLRANQIQQILSMPHEEHCPLYSYTRCKKLGLDFNVGSGVKQNLDLKLLTNGVMVELCTFATALVSAQKHFMTEILEYNFDLNFKNELCRSVFAQQIWTICNATRIRNSKISLLRMPVELPDMTCIREPTYDKTTYCPKCYQDRNCMLCEDGSDTGPMHHLRPHIMIDTVSANANCTAQKPAKDLSPTISIEKTIMDSYPLCKKIGLNLCVDKDHPKDKLDTHILTRGIMKEVLNFATTLCGLKRGLINEVLEHNFNIGMHSGDLHPQQELSTLTAVKDSGLAWFDEVFVSEPFTHRRVVHGRQLKQSSAMQRSNWKETIEKRKMTLQTKDKKNPLPRSNLSVIKPKTYPVPKVHLFPICTKIGLDLDVTSKSREKEKLDLKLLTTAVVFEIHKFASKYKVGQYLPGTLFDILDYNFDLSSQHYRHWEFSLATAFKVQALVKQYRTKQIGTDEVFELPFVFPHKGKQRFLEKRHKSFCKNSSQEEPDENQNKGSCVHQVGCQSDMSCVSFLSGVKTKEEPCSHVEDSKSSIDSLTKNVQMNENLVSVGCDTSLQLNTQIKEEEYDPHYGDMKPELNSGKKYQPHYADVKTESNTEDMDYLVPDESLGLHGNADTQDRLQNPTKCNIPRESESSCLVICEPLSLTTCISTSLPTVSSNLNPLSTSQHDESKFFGSKGQTQTPKNAPNEIDMEQDKMRSEDNWISPLECDLNSDDITESHSTGNEYHVQNPPSSTTIRRETQLSCVVICSPLPTTTDISSSLPTVISNMDSSFASKSDKRWLCEGEEKEQTERNTLKECDMEQEEIVKEPNMWKLRANRVEQILSARNKEFFPFKWSRQYGLEFNVGFGPKQNIGMDLLTNAVLLEIAKFALAMNSSQQDFIMEILEYNFDLGLQTQQQRNTFACETMNRVRQLRRCEDAVKLSNEVFELPGPMPSIYMTSQSVDSVIPELNSIPQRKHDVAPVCPLDSHAETRTHLSRKSTDLYPSCKQIGLKLHVNNSQPNKKLNINTLTHGAMLEVTNFAEELCGTFEQICLDIIRHNFDLDLESGDSDLTKNILARIAAAMEQNNLSSISKSNKKTKSTKNDISTVEKQDYQNILNLDACYSGSSQATIVDQNEGSSPDIKHQKKYNLKLWKLRANQIKRILLIPHKENCPLYSYSRCKKIGLDFNVGSGVKQSLDSKLFTNGVMAELYTFATALVSAQEHFMTEVLEYNFDLNFENELCRIAFAQQTMQKCNAKIRYKLTSNSPGLTLPFELPDIKSSQDVTTYCPKCYQDQIHKLRQTESDTSQTSGAVNCSAEKAVKDPCSTFLTTEKIIMGNYPRCKKMDLNLFVDREQRKDKLDKHALTCGIMMEVAHFAKKLCGNKSKVINDLLEHNSNLSIQSGDINSAVLSKGVMSLTHDNPAWLDEVFVVPRYPHRSSEYKSMLKREAAMHGRDLKKTIKTRKLALQTKKERVTLPSHKSAVNSKKKYGNTKIYYPICTKIGLDLAVRSKYGDKQKLDLRQLTRAVVLEIHEFATKKVGQYYSRTVFDILDYNFDLSSVHYRRLEFSIATASKIQSMVNQYCEQLDRADEVFILPFDMDPNASLRLLESAKNNKNASSSLDIESRSESDFQGVCAPYLNSTDISSTLTTMDSSMQPQYASQLEKGLCGDEELTQTSRIAPNECDLEDEMGPGNIMWKLRANRVEQILSAQNKTSNAFYCSRQYGLEFNVGFGPKQNRSGDSLSDYFLLKIAKFALAVSSSQQYFIMEILEYNFDLGLQTQQQRNTFTCEMMNTVRQLKRCEDVVKLSNDVFRLTFPLPAINTASQSVGCVIPELNSISWRKHDVAPPCPSDSHAETGTHLSHKSMDLYPSCKKIGLKLHVNNSQPNKKLDINTLTNGAMLEVTNFAEELCGTFEQICLDIIRHNFDLDLESGDSDLTENILARITAAIEQCNLSPALKCYKTAKCTRNDISTVEKQDSQINLNIDACNAGSSKAEILDQNKGSFSDTENLDKHTLKMWKLRANQIQRILSIPHEEQCPFYSYTRCKKLGLDFNVGSGVKQNLDPKLLTHGIMVELRAFAIALVSARKDFITEILEQNFDLNFKNELCRIAFAEQTMQKCNPKIRRKLPSGSPRLRLPFELPDIKSIQEANEYCPKCYQDRSLKLHLDESDTGHIYHPYPFKMTDKVYGDVNRSAEESTFSTTEKTMMDNYPHCKKIGFNLLVNREQPEDKLDTHVLTCGIMMEVAHFAQKLCGTTNEVINDLLKHNFNIGMKSQDLNPAELFYTEMSRKHDGLAWLGEVFVIQRYPHRPPGYLSKLKRETAMQGNELKKTIKRRKLALQTKEERATLPSHKRRVVKSKKTYGRTVNCYPNCTKIGLDLDVTSKSGDKEKLDIELLTRAVVLEIHEFATKEVRYYYARTVFDILDYNFDLSSVHYRRWEFITATASKIQTMVEQYCEQLDGADEVFKLPFLMDPEVSRRLVESRQNKKSESSSMDIERGSESSCQGICAPFFKSPKVSSSLLTVNSNLNPTFESQPDKIGFLRGEEQTKTPRNGSNESDMEQEEMVAENYYTCPLGESDVDSEEVTDSEDTGNQDHFKDPESCSSSSDIPRESESICLDVHAPFHTSTDISSSLPTVNSNMDLLFVSEHDEKQLCRNEELTQTPESVPNEWDLEDEMGPGDIMWKLRANRVEHILSAQNKEFGQSKWSRRHGLEFNVGFGPKQTISVDSLTNAVLLEIAKFALAINSSQQDFIMEILEYNFDLGLQTQQQRNTFACEMMNRVRQLRRCEDTVKLSDEVFNLTFLIPSIHLGNQSVGSVIPKLSSILTKEKCDVAPVCPLDSHAETNEHTGILHQKVDLYPFCKKTGLKLHVNHSQPNKKLDINKLTNGAMTEVTIFAEKLCGTFEQICLDILRHNFDLDLESGDSDFTENILARIAAAVEQKNLSTVSKSKKKTKSTRNDISTVEKQDCQNIVNLDACYSGSSQAAIVDQNEGSSADIEHLDGYNLKLWKVRANQIKRILSIPHEEHCPLYSYSRCKKLGIDFNVGSGVKQNLDLKLLTNGVMVELCTFATALVSAQKHFMTEILEQNFGLNFENELCRGVFAQQIWTICNASKIKNSKISLLRMPVELPDMTCIREPTYDKTTYCPKCYQDGYHILSQNESDTGPMHHLRPHTMTDTVSAEANCTAQKPAKDLSPTISIEKTIMDSYPLCKKTGLNLCVDKDHPKDKLDTDILTRGIMKEVASFAKKLCGTMSGIVSTLLKHNFNISMTIHGTDLLQMFSRAKAQNDGKVAWFSEVFTIHPVSHRKSGSVSQPKMEAVNYRSERRETIQKRKVALQTQEERATLPSQNIRVTKPKINPQSTGIYYPVCTKIGLDLDVTSKSGEKEKLDLKLLTTAVVFEIHKFASSYKVGQYLPGTLFDILDYNFDLSSQHYRRWEFSIATASKVQALVKHYRTKRDRADKVFKLPFVFPTKTKPRLAEKGPKQKTKKGSHKGPDKKRKHGSCVRQVRYHSDVTCAHFLSGVQTNEEPWFHDENTKSSKDSLIQNVQMNDNVVSEGCGSPLQGNMQVKEEEYDPHYVDMKPELDTDEKYHPPYDDVKMESNTGNVEHFVPSELAGSLGYTLTTMCPYYEGNRKSDSENEGVQYYILAEPQGSEGHAMLAKWPNTESIMKTELDTANVNYLAPVEVAASQEYFMVTIGQGNESKLIKEEREQTPIDS